MITTCQACGEVYEDADRMTFCPHPYIMPPEDLDRKKLALQMFDSKKKYRLKTTGHIGRLTSIDAIGYVTLEGLAYLDLIDPVNLELAE